jgi:hypothetical protein
MVDLSINCQSPIAGGGLYSMGQDHTGNKHGFRACKAILFPHAAATCNILPAHQHTRVLVRVPKDVMAIHTNQGIRNNTKVNTTYTALHASVQDGDCVCR